MRPCPQIREMKTMMFVAFLALIISMSVIQSRRDAPEENGGDGQTDSEGPVGNVAAVALEKGHPGHETTQSFTVSSDDEPSTDGVVSITSNLTTRNTKAQGVVTSAGAGHPDSAPQDIHAHGVIELLDAAQPTSVSTSEDFQATNAILVHDDDLYRQVGIRIGIGIAMVVQFFKQVFSDGYAMLMNPYVIVFVITGLKGGLADGIAQISQRDEAGDRMPFKQLRNFAFIIYAGSYSGCVQYFMYNTLFPVWFGQGSDLVTVLCKVMYDLLVLAPIVCLPCAYLTRAVIFNGPSLESLQDGLSSYKYDVDHDKLLEKYWMFWGPVQFFTFSVIPVHLRMVFISIASFFWMVILSGIMGKEDQKEVNDRNRSVPKYVRAYCYNRMIAIQSHVRHPDFSDPPSGGEASAESLATPRIY